MTAIGGGERLLRSSEVAEQLGVDRRTVARWTGRGLVPAVVHRGRLYPSIDEALKARDSARPAGRPRHAGSVSVRVPRSVLATWACRLEELSRSGPDDVAVVAHELAGRIALYAVRRDDSC